MTRSCDSHSVPHIQGVEAVQGDAGQCRQGHWSDVEGESTVVVEGPVRVVEERHQQDDNHGQDQQQIHRIHLLQANKVDS